MSESTFDYIIVGAGTAGCLMAKRLSEAKHRKRVLMLEAGGRDDYHWVHIPVGYLYCIGNPRTDWQYQTEAAKGLNGRSLRYPRGKVLGGCSSINGMIYMRGQARDYDDWAAQLGDSEWSWERSLPDFKTHESYYQLDGASKLDEQAKSEIAKWHGHHRASNSSGEWRVEKQRLSWEILDAFAQAAQSAGIPATDDFNRGNNEGVGYFEVNQRAGWRWNTAKAFLRPVCYGRSNYEQWTGAQVKRLLFEDRPDQSQRCVGVEVWTGEQIVQVKADCEVILCAGSIGTPQILQLSGIGAAAQLAQLGIASVADLKGVGENLQDHLQIRSVYQVSHVPTLNTLTASWWGKAKIGIEYLVKRTGPMSMAPSQLGAFTRSDASQVHPNLEYHVQPLSLEAFGEPLHRYNAFTASVCNLNPSSRGTVHLKSADFKQAPAIDPNYLSTHEDLKIAADSLRLTRCIVAQSALAKYQPTEIKPGVQYQSDEVLSRLAGDIATTIFHPVGTCKMGKVDDAMAVVNSRLQVFDGKGGLIKGLRVVDASIMPTITSGNTNSPTLMIAEKAARFIMHDNG